MRTYFNATRGGTAVDWSVAACSEPSLECPDYWEIEGDLREAARCHEDRCIDNFLTSVELD